MAITKAIKKVAKKVTKKTEKKVEMTKKEFQQKGFNKTVGHAK